MENLDIQVYQHCPPSLLHFKHACLYDAFKMAENQYLILFFILGASWKLPKRWRILPNLSHYHDYFQGYVCNADSAYSLGFPFVHQDGGSISANKSWGDSLPVTPFIFYRLPAYFFLCLDVKKIIPRNTSTTAFPWIRAQCSRVKTETWSTVNIW